MPGTIAMSSRTRCHRRDLLSRTLGSGLIVLMLYVAWEERTRAGISARRLLSRFPSTLGLDLLGHLGISFPGQRALFLVPCLGIVLWLI